MARATPAKKGTPPKVKPVIDDVEDLLNVASDERDLIWLSRLGGATGWELLETVSPAGMREPGIAAWTQQKYGGGRFRARIRQRNGAWGHSRQFSVAGEPKMPAAAATSTAAAVEPTRGSFELPSWVEKVLVPAAVTLTAGIASKLLADPKTDPLVLELLRRSGKNDGVDPLELQRVIADAEARGEARGVRIGELTASSRRSARNDSGESSSGTLSAIRETAAVVKDFVAMRRAPVDAPAPPRRVLPPGAPPASSHEDSVMSPKAAADAAPDIVPEWLRPMMKFRPLLLMMADSAGSADTTAAHVINDVDEQTWFAIVQARADGRLESDLLAAVPELGSSERRRAFVAELVELVTEAVDHPENGGTEDDVVAGAGGDA